MRNSPFSSETGLFLCPGAMPVALDRHAVPDRLRALRNRPIKSYRGMGVPPVSQRIGAKPSQLPSTT